MYSVTDMMGFIYDVLVIAGALIPGAGAFEFALREHLLKFANEGNVKGKARFGVQAYAEAFLIIPKTLAQNAGFDGQEVMVKLQEEARESHRAVGVDCDSGMYCILSYII